MFFRFFFLLFKVINNSLLHSLKYTVHIDSLLVMFYSRISLYSKMRVLDIVIFTRRTVSCNRKLGDFLDKKKKKITRVFQKPDPKNPENLCGYTFLYDFCIDSI